MPNLSDNITISRIGKVTLQLGDIISPHVLNDLIADNTNRIYDVFNFKVGDQIVKWKIE